MGLSFRRWVHPGFEWLQEGALQGRAGRFEHVLGRGRVSGTDHLSISLALAARVFGGGARASDPLVRARIRDHLDAAALTRGHERSRIEATRLSWSLRLVEGEVDEGLRELHDAERLWPRLASAFEIDATRILLEVGPLEEAVRFLDRTSEDARRSLAYDVAVAIFDREAGHPAPALERLERIVTRAPTLSDPLFERAKTHWALGARSEALADLSRLQMIRPGCSSSARNLLLASVEAGRFDEARRMWAGVRPLVRADHEIRKCMERLGSKAGVLEPRGPKVLQGDLSLVALSDVLGLLGHARSTGVLSIESETGSSPAELRLARGRLVDARLPGSPVRSRPASVKEVEQRVLHALETLLQWKKGTFSLQPETLDAEFPTAIDTPSALLQACANLDERRRSAGP
ncbi:MAG: DUF4388 domain-containing protein [Myxococcota bacterium]